ncbi:hypothetical protein BOTBODRAFT_136323 [Botryobasidium botryosum FD-172 SS1]|uniref:Uncharacterized protein n=1 Tax=Botryobasidium botryosum (strain FD-172 SS1) TaxID=930990 RepID=A0A067MHJ6_BOTB1|nr:hypothetical protein BOTBODRAFT_136323 [Botryobasidium botryosum FD-172 SS1]
MGNPSDSDDPVRRQDEPNIHDIILLTGGAKGGGGRASSGSGAKGGKGGSSLGGGQGVRGDSIPLGSSTSKPASAYSPGGGPHLTIPPGTTFAGRPIGGGTRGGVYGNQIYGSGYQNGAHGSWVSGRGFSYGFWPFYWAGGIGAGAALSHGYYGSHEYGPENNSSRPGGEQTYAQVRSISWPNSTTTPDNSTAPYYLLGDKSSVAVVLDALVLNCSVVNTTSSITAFNFTLNSTSTPRPEQVVQYYRESSFALSLSTYIDKASLPSEAPPTEDSALPDPSLITPLPPGTNLGFLDCLNQTIGAAVPIMNSGMAGSQFGGSATTLLLGFWLIMAFLRRIF